MSYILIPSIILLAFSAFSSILLIVKGDIKTCHMKLLGGTLLIYTLFFLTYVLWFDFGFILKYPHLLRSISPFMFLVGPLFYLSIRNTVYGITGFQKKDWLHLLPAIIHFLELMPLYLLSSDEKLVIAEKVIVEQGGLDIYAHGVFPGIWIDVIRLLLILGYFLYSVYLVFVANPVLLETLKREKFKNWLFVTLVFFGMIHVFFLGQYIHAIQFFFTGVFFPGLRTILVVLMLLSILAYNVYNFIRLELTLGMSGVEPEPAKQLIIEKIKHQYFPSEKPNNPSYFEGETSHDPDEIREKLAGLLEEDKIYLKQGLLKNDFAKELGISPRHLPEVLDQFYGKGFKDLINQYRVSYAKEKIENGYLDVFTLESLGSEAGFNSRTTFFSVFKKELNLSPSDFWKRFQEGPTHDD